MKLNLYTRLLIFVLCFNGFLEKKTLFVFVTNKMICSKLLKLEFVKIFVKLFQF